jgi:hypothetical protein
VKVAERGPRWSELVLQTERHGTWYVAYLSRQSIVEDREREKRRSQKAAFPRARARAVSSLLADAPPPNLRAPSADNPLFARIARASFSLRIARSRRRATPELQTRSQAPTSPPRRLGALMLTTPASQAL